MASMMDDEKCDPTLTSVFEAKSLKWIFVGGKGGVGKTTTACSIAAELSKARESVLILSTDPAHNLSDAFGQKFGSSPTLVDGFRNLYAMELKSKLQESVGFSLPGADEDSSFSKMIPELLQAFPGIDEALGFAELMNSVRSMNYSVVVFDTAPTGHTLRLISFPELLQKGLEKLANWRESLPGALSMINSVSGGVINEEEIHSRLDALHAVTASVKQQFEDPTRTTFICVCIPEFLSVYETERLIQELARHKIDCSSVVVNQVLFPFEEIDALKIDAEVIKEASQALTNKGNGGIAHDTLLRSYETLLNLKRKADLLEANYLCRRKMQSKYLQQVDELYSCDFHVVAMPLQTQEVRGVDDLRAFARLLREPKPLPIVSQ